MLALYQLHSGLRYLVLLAGVVALAYCAFGLAARRPPGRATRALGATFVGLLDLQILVGVALVLSGRWSPVVVGHLVMMLLASINAHGLLVISRRSARPGFGLPIAAVGVSLALIIGGIFAIGRGPFTSTALG
jgi:heme A synthase